MMKSRYKPEYTAWVGMRSRCNDKNNPRYHRYGARGIKVCGKWDYFESFLADVGKRPTKHHSIDRIDNDGNYEPSNVRWATNKEQMRNFSLNVNVEINGIIKCMKDWAEEFGISYSTVSDRRRRGMNVIEALTKSVNQNEKLIECRGKTLSIAGWAKEVGLTPKAISARIIRGWSYENAIFTPEIKTRIIEFQGQKKTTREWAKEIGISHSYINQRIKKGFSIEEVIRKKNAKKDHK